MIFTESTIKISNNVSKMDSTIVLYRGDKNVEIRFTILQSPFKYSNTVATNVIESTNASYGQLVIKTPNDKPPIFSEVSATKEGTVLFTITKEMIDEIEELGVYTFQIRLMDENKQSRVTIPPVENGIEIKEPIAIEDDNTTNVVGLAKANYAVATLSDVDTPAFDDAGKYIKTSWNDGDIITDALLNKIEDGIYTTNENVTATKKYVDDNTPIKSFPVNPTTKTAATVDVNNITSSGCYALPKRADGTQWTNLRMRAIVNDGSGNSKVLLLTGYQNFVFHVNIESKKIYCDNLRIVYNIGTTADTTYIDTEPYYLSTTNTKEYTPTNDYNPATKKYVDDNRIGYIKSETVGETIDTSTMINSFNNNSYIYESNNVTYLEMGKEYHVIVNGVRYRALCINNMPGNDQIYETIAVTGDGFSISIMNKMGYNTKYYTDNTKCAYEIKLSDELLAAPPTIQILKMDIEYIPTYLMSKDLEILNSISVNRIGDIGTGSAAIGYKNTASNDFTFAMGIQTTASAPGAHAEGGLTVAKASYSHAEGFKSGSTGEYSHVEGIVCESSGQGSHAEGYYTVSSGQRSHSEGCFTEAASQYQHVQGKYNVVDSNGVYAHIVGNGTGKNNRHNAHTLDWQGNAWFAGEVQGTNLPYTVSSKVLTTIPASDIKLDGEIAVNNVSINKDRRYYIEFLGSKKLCSLLINGEIGDFIICSIGNYSIEIHNNTFNISIYIDKINTSDTTDTFTDLIIYEEEVKYLDNKYLETDLTLQNSISLGRIGDIGTGSSAIGCSVIASGNYAHAEGGDATALGDYSHAEGYGTIASGYGSHAEGSTTTASGVSSHAEGDYTTASGASSHAEGYGTKASSQFQHVQGKYNIEDKDRKYAHIVGNGAGDAKRSNAHALDWKGNGWYAGKLSQEGTPTDDKDLTTKKYVDDNILLEQLPILRIDETNKRIYVNCNNMGTYKKYFVPNKYANVYGFSFIYTNEDSSETEIALVGGAMTRDDFILCARNTDTLFILILGGTDKYTYTKSTKTLEKGLYGYLKIGNTQEYTPTNEYNPATKKYVDDKVTSLPQLSFNEAGELVVTINGVSKTFVPKNV